MEEMMITIPVDDYRLCLEDRAQLDLLLQVILGHASLSYTKDKLRFDDDMIANVLRVVCPNGYTEKLKALQAEVKEA